MLPYKTYMQNNVKSIIFIITDTQQPRLNRIHCNCMEEEDISQSQYYVVQHSIAVSVLSHYTMFYRLARVNTHP